jgi:hypothetical protein
VAFGGAWVKTAACGDQTTVRSVLQTRLVRGSKLDNLLSLIELIIHDFSDGAGTATAPNSATKTDIDRARGTARHRPRDSSHLVVGHHVAGANNHRKMAPIAGLQRK